MSSDSGLNLKLVGILEQLTASAIGLPDGEKEIATDLTDYLIGVGTQMILVNSSPPESSLIIAT